MPGKVLDSFALIAYFRDELGAGLVESLLVAAGKKDAPLHMSEVNYAQVKYSIIRQEGADAWAAAEKVLQSLPIQFHPATREQADAAAGFKVRLKLSLADAFAAALAMEKKAELITGDPEFKALEREIKLCFIQ